MCACGCGQVGYVDVAPSMEVQQAGAPRRQATGDIEAWAWPPPGKEGRIGLPH